MGSSDDHAVVMGDWFSRDEFGNYVDRNCSISKNDASNAKSQLNTGGGLAERMAARAGFRAPSRLNTEALRSPGLYSKPDARFRFLTVPPGPSPTTLLESPVFLSNSMVQPSPTTGKFHFATSINNQDSTLMLHDGDTGKKNTCEDPNGSSFTFKSSSELAPLTHVDEANKSLRKADVALHREQPGQRSTGPLISQVDSSSFLFHEPSFSHPDQNHCPVPVPKNRRSGEELAAGDSSAEDGYSWRKYGQKHVKGSEYPRSYYKCTNQNCPVKKKVERSNEGHITEIIYKGAHNHPKPDNLEPLSSLQLGREYGNELVDGVEELSALSNNDEDDRVMHGSVALDESESKRRRMESYGGEVCGASRGIREPKVVVQTRSDVDVLDDGYRWRKYGQKVVKGNPNPRSYYKCTSPGCNVRKHVERASHDLKSVITTYEGKHNHDVPTARNSGNLNSEGPNTQHAPVRDMSSLGLLAQPQPGPGLWMTRPSPPPLLQLEPIMGSRSNSARGSSPYLQQLMGNVSFLKTFSW